VVIRCGGPADVPALEPQTLQALGMLRAGLDLDGELLALAAASRSGEAFHIDGVRRVLAGAGLDPIALRTPAGYPLDELARNDWIRAGHAAVRPAPELARVLDALAAH